MVTPRLIGRLEIAYADGSTETVVTNRDWRAAFGPMVTDHWFGGTDYDARREQAGWTEPGADLSPSASRRDGTEVGWRSAGIAPPPNLTTKLAARNAEPVKVQETFDAGEADEPAARRLGLRLRPELRRLARAAPAGRDPRRARSSRCCRRRR